MDGGIDATYVSYFGSGIQKRVQGQILDHHAGELIVGAADIVETGSTAHPYLIIAPTMRVPMILRHSVNAYLAMRAVLLLVTQGRFRDGPRRGEKVAEHIKVVAMPGLGTGVGTIGPNTCAHQMRIAIDDILLGRFRLPNSWAEASISHQTLYTTNIRHLQQE
jgi:O-acetyl-ADP-ribose deacetylase (regulator of RNase III)